MTSPGSPPQGFIWPVVTPADIEGMVQYFLTPLMSPTPVATRLPDDKDPTDTNNGFIRVESGGGPKVSLTQFHQTFMLSTYIPDEFEVSGAQIAQNATAWVSAVGGQKIAGYYVDKVIRSTAPQRRTDPRVNLLRYLSMVTWKVTGNPVT